MSEKLVDLQKALDKFYSKLANYKPENDNEHMLMNVVRADFDLNVRPKFAEFLRGQDVFRKQLTELMEGAVKGEQIRFGIDSMNRIADWKGKHNLQDMKFVPVPALEKLLLADGLSKSPLSDEMAKVVAKEVSGLSKKKENPEK